RRRAAGGRKPRIGAGVPPPGAGRDRHLPVRGGGSEHRQLPDQLHRRAAHRRPVACRRRPLRQHLLGRGDGGALHRLRRDARRQPRQDAGLRRAGLAGGGRLYGSGQLGDRHRRRIGVRLHPALRRAAVEPDGDRAAIAVGAAGDRGWRMRPATGQGPETQVV
ncbi:hypothetical protein LTR94_025603, partial [Friedmanniomyces endolithicus]